LELCNQLRRRKTHVHQPRYHGFGLTGYRYVRQEFHEGQVTFHIEQPRERLRCSNCRSAAVWAQGGIERTFRTVPIGSKPVLLRFKVPRVHCFNCGLARQVKVGFADPTKAL
jgi:transposase